MSIRHIDIGKEFSKTLGPRYKRLGEYSGEEFRESLLEPAFIRNDIVVVDLDSFTGYSASFLEEAFGGLVRKYGLEKVEAKVKFAASRRQYLIPKVQAWMREAEAEFLSGAGASLNGR